MADQHTYDQGLIDASKMAQGQITDLSKAVNDLSEQLAQLRAAHLLMQIRLSGLRIYCTENTEAELLGVVDRIDSILDD
jgi:hypothetical protein